MICPEVILCVVHFSSVQSHDRLDRRGDTKDDSANIFFQSVLQEALVSRSGMGRDVFSALDKMLNPSTNFIVFTFDFFFLIQCAGIG